MTPDRELGLLFIAILLLLGSLTKPVFPLEQDSFRYIFAIDITQSMNTRDYSEPGLPEDRLSFAKIALRQALRELPCGSEAGIGIFTTKDLLLLLPPVEICKHFSALDELVSHIDWRMAWAADSNIERGLYGSIIALKRMESAAHLVFITDGEQSIQELHRPPLEKYHGAIPGIIFGAGNNIPTPIPKLDKNNRIIGYWSNSEVHGSSSPQSAQNNLPTGKEADGRYLSVVDENNLRELALVTGLEYRPLKTPEQFLQALLSPKHAYPRVFDTRIDRLFAAAALLLLMPIYLLSARSAG